MDKREDGQITVTKEYSSDGKESIEEERIPFEVFKTEPAVVSLEYGLTINMGNYESCRLTVGVRLPCYKEQIEETYARASEWVEKKVIAESKAIRKSSHPF